MEMFDELENDHGEERQCCEDRMTFKEKLDYFQFIQTNSVPQKLNGKVIGGEIIEPELLLIHARSKKVTRVKVCKISPSIQKLNISSKGLKVSFENIIEIGQGGFGKVYKAKSIMDGLEYAVKKVILPDSLESEHVLLEVNTLAKLRSDCVVRYISSWLEDKCLFIQMELCSDNLKNIIDNKNIVFQRKPLETMNAIEYYIMCRLFIEILECVQYLHEYKPPIIHRDIKPHNILFDNNGTNGRFLKLCDFGLAKYQDINTMVTSKGSGSYKYTAPEVFRLESYDWRSDIYSLSIIGQELFEIDFNSSRSMSPMNCGHKTQLRELEYTLSQMFHHIYRNRPSCSDILDDCYKWALNVNDIKISAEFINHLNNIDQQSIVQFVKFYLKIA